MTERILIIDVREESELLDIQIKTNSQDIVVLNIPSRSIFTNVDFINEISNNFDYVYLICQSGRRTSKIKEKYFANNPKIKSYKGGWKALEKRQDIPNVIVKHSYSLLNLSPQQYMQEIIFIFLLSMIILSYTNKVNQRYINIALLFFALFILYQAITKDCLMTAMIPLSDKL